MVAVEAHAAANNVRMEFDAYVRARGRSLERLAFLLCGNHHTAEDLTQTALAKAFVRWRRIGSLEHPDAYVRQILVRTYMSEQRRRSAREVVTILVPDKPEPMADAAYDPRQRQWLLRLVSALPPRAKAVVVLRYYEDLDNAAIAQLLGISESAVRSTASRALAKLNSWAQDPLREDR